VRHLLDVKKNDGLPRPLAQIGERPIQPRELLANRGLAFRARRRVVDRYRLQREGHLAPPQQIQAESPRDRDVPRQQRPLGIESLEVDKGPDERVLREVFGVVGSNQSPAEPKNGPVKAPDQLVEDRRVAASGATRKIEFSLPFVRPPVRSRGHTPRRPQRSTGGADGLFRAPSGGGAADHATGCWAPRGGPLTSSNDCAKARSLASGSSRSMCSPSGWRTLYGVV